MIALKCAVFKAFDVLGQTCHVNPAGWNLQVTSCVKHKPMKGRKLLLVDLPCRVGKTTESYDSGCFILL